jgi:glutathione peroxidase-family protein
MVAQGASTPRPVADVTIPVAEGKPVKVSQYRGKVMVIALISTTCGHCIGSLQMLGKLQKEFGPQGFQVLGVAADDNAQSGIVGLAKLQTGIPLGYLDQNTTMQLVDFNRNEHPFVPIYMFVDRKGTVRFQYGGKDDFFKNEEKNTRLLVEGMLKQK